MKRNKKIWVFDGGNKFLDNPKYYFIYINRYRKNVKAYWLCRNKKLLKKIRKQGYKAILNTSFFGKYIQKKAGVYVVDQVKKTYPKFLKGSIILNLWHGVGCKTIEKKLKDGIVFKEVARKYIKNNEMYYNNQLFLVTSPLMEKHFKESLGLKNSNIIRGGYPCNIKNFKVKTFDHNIKKNLPKNVKIALYSPTFRENEDNNFILNAIPDFDKLHEVLVKNDILLIFKMHPLMENEINYKNAKEKYKNYSNFLFWNPENDIYEIFDQIDLAIVDYSSMFYNLLSAGIKDFVRYVFDYDDKENVRDFVFDYKEMTYGNLAYDFDELIKLLKIYKKGSYYNKIQNNKINKLFWEYSDDKTFDTIYNFTMNFVPEYQNLDPIYSFDIFDTLIKRKGGTPESTFCLVKDKILDSNIKCDNYFKYNFVDIRKNIETNLRQFYSKTNYNRKVKKYEITLDEIYNQIENDFEISKTDIELIKKWEIESEIENCIPKIENIKLIHKLLDDKMDVVLISDMYLPLEVVKEIIKKADPILLNLPLYLSNEFNARKINGNLYYEVYKEMDYKYSKWIHYGDNQVSDIEQSKKIGIKPVLIKKIEFNDYENKLINYFNSYDSYVTSEILKNFRSENSEELYFIYSHIAFLFVPYVCWLIDDALEKSFDTLYFISRDGEILKHIADSVIKERKLKIKTKYIYGSRVAWRVPSFIDKVDDEFFENFGNINDGINEYDQLLDTLMIDDKTFKKFLPDLKLKTGDLVDKKVINNVKKVLKNNDEYKNIILKIAKEKRKSVTGYLKQEIDFKEKFAFVDYWARGYTQDCLTRLIENATDNEINKTYFYYLRSINKSNDKNIRYNFTNKNFSVTFVESILSNLPYDSIKNYSYEGSKYVPVISKIDYNKEFYDNVIYCFNLMASKFASTSWYNKNNIYKQLYSFAVDEYNNINNTALYANYIGNLKYSGWLNGSTTEYAPKITFKDVIKAKKGDEFIDTNSKEISLVRTNKFLYKMYLLKTRGLKKIVIRKLKKFKVKNV